MMGHSSWGGCQAASFIYPTSCYRGSQGNHKPPLRILYSYELCRSWSGYIVFWIVPQRLWNVQLETSHGNQMNFFRKFSLKKYLLWQSCFEGILSNDLFLKIRKLPKKCSTRDGFILSWCCSTLLRKSLLSWTTKKSTKVFQQSFWSVSFTVDSQSIMTVRCF